MEINIYKLSSRFFDSKQRMLQATSLFGSTIFATGFSFIANIYVTRSLNATGYGNFKFIFTAWTFINLLFSFGILRSAGQALVVEKDEKVLRELSGTTLIVSLILGFVLVLIIYLTAYPLDILFRTNLRTTIWFIAPLAFILPFMDGMGFILQSTNKIFALSILNAFPPFVYMIASFIYYHFDRFTISMVFCFQQIPDLIILIYIVAFILKPSFRNIRKSLRLIRKHYKGYGWPVYLGSLCSVATAQINSLAIPYWVDTKAIGFYALASQLASPLKTIPGSVATSSFREFAQNDSISKKTLQSTIAVSFVSLVVLLIFLGEPIKWLFSKDFSVVGPMASIAAIGAMVHGFGDLLNQFLGSHGKGLQLRNASYFVGLINLVGFIILVPLYGAWGGILSTVLLNFSYFCLMLFYYIKIQKSNVK